MIALLVLSLLTADSRSQRWAKPDARDRRAGRVVQTKSATAATCNPACGVPQYCVGTTCTDPTLSFATTAGTGMTTACAGTAVTLVDGTSTTFTRASNGTCMKGGTLTGIANGDVVILSSNKPRVMYGGAGTGVLGVLKEPASVNVVHYSEAFDNVYWAQYGGGAAAPSVTADAAVAPDGATTADRVQIAATTTGQYSIVYASAACAQGTASVSCFVRGVSGSGTTDIGVVVDAATYATAPCAFVSTSWTRCTSENNTVVTDGSLFFGNSTFENGGTARNASDVYLWGCQCEAQTRTTSYIPTTSASASRAVEHLAASVTWPLSATASMSAQVVTPSHIDTLDTAFMLSVNASNYFLDYTGSGPNKADIDIATSVTSQSTVASWAASSLNWVGLKYDGTKQYSCLNGTCASANQTLVLPSGSMTLSIGEDLSGGGDQPAAVIKNLCLDVSSTVCVTQ